MKLFGSVTAVMLVVTTMVSGVIVSAEPPTQVDEMALVAALREGGHVIFFRHAQEAGEDQNPLNLEDCATQQFLSDEGHAQSRAIGEAFRTLAIPVSRVLSSPVCRAYDTAIGAFGDAEVVDMLSLPATLDPASRERQPEGVAALLATAPAPGTNTILVSHSNLLMMVAGVGVERAEAAIFAVDGQGVFTFVRHVAGDAWHELERE
jgi:broad specificity phosphatase PhoE